MLQFNVSWRFTPPPDGRWKNQTIPLSAVDGFYNLIVKAASQGKNRQEILEHFKGNFCNAVGKPHFWSSTESWAETDLLNFMERATKNAPLFLEAFYDACNSLSAMNKNLFAPDEEIINALCIRHNIGYVIKPPHLLLRDSGISDQKAKNNNGDEPTSDSRTSSTRSSNKLHRLQVFLCYASGDKPRIRELYARLRNDGFTPWLDEENLLPGHDWQIEISKAVRNSDVVIVCLSKASITKEGYVQKEIRQALDVADEKPENTIFLIPLKLEECDVPERLKKWQWVNLFEDNGYERLKRSLRIRAKSKNKL